MTYEYRCDTCRVAFDVVKSVKEIDREETCPRCNQAAKRQFVPSRLYLSGTKVEHAEYNPGLGCVVKSKRHRDEICKRKGFVEIGNDFQEPERIHKKFDQEREDRREARYEQVMKEIV